MTDSERLELLLQAVTNIQVDLQDVKVDLQDVKVDLQDVKVDLQDVKVDLQDAKVEIADLKKKVSIIELTLENEISHNIMVIAEGHLDLNRKLDEAIHLTSDIKAKQEIQDLYIKRHDNKLRTKGIS